jgi:hypothetical protein
LASLPSVHTAGTADAWQAWRAEETEWRSKRDTRLQHVLAHMNHHIHPVVNFETGERRPLTSCQPKHRPKECKGGFPLENEMTDHAVLVCPCFAKEVGLEASGARSRIGTILPVRNDPWLNAAPVSWAEFSGDNGDIKCPMRVPVLPETHEVRLYGIQRCCGKKTELDLAYEVQVGRVVTAVYFGGYSAKMQHIGRKELLSLEQGIVRKAAVSDSSSDRKAFQNYAKRLVRDLEGNGIVRTAVETCNLAVHSDERDVLSAECIRTFASVTFPAMLLLRREEVETGKVPGHSIVAAVAAGSGSRRPRAYQEAPFDLMYGFRGRGTGKISTSPSHVFASGRWRRCARRRPSLGRRDRDGQKLASSIARNANSQNKHQTTRRECTTKQSPPRVACSFPISLPSEDCAIVGYGRSALDLTFRSGASRRCQRRTSHQRRTPECCACT